MESRRVAPTLGIVASLGVVVLLVVPYLLVEESTNVAAYYDGGVITPWAAGLMALAAVIIFAAGLKNRTDPETAAGAGVGLGFVVLLVVLLWAITAPETISGVNRTRQLFGPLLTMGGFADVHRWVLLAVSALVPAAGVWYARALRLF